jgi:hypothetical protein
MEQENAGREEMARQEEKDTQRKHYQRPILTEYGSIIGLTQGSGGTVPDGKPAEGSRGV